MNTGLGGREGSTRSIIAGDFKIGGYTVPGLGRKVGAHGFNLVLANQPGNRDREASPACGISVFTRIGGERGKEGAVGEMLGPRVETSLEFSPGRGGRLPGMGT